MHRYVSCLGLGLLVLGGCASFGGNGGAGSAQEDGGGAFQQAVEGLDRLSGLMEVRLDREKGRALLELPVGDDGEILGEFLYVESLRTGLGSNPVGLDRGQLGPTRLIRFRRVGERVLIEEANLAFRAMSEDPRERAAVGESFATSVLWGGPIEAAEDGRLLVDLTDFLVRDAHGSAQRIQRAGQGSFHLDKDRSALDLDATLVFADNAEFEAVLTFGGDEPGGLVRETTPSADSVTLVQHHSFIRLPREGYAPRRFDPRVSSFPVTFADYASPLDGDLMTRWIARHRLEKVEPGAAPSRVVEPIVYYVDPGAPEPIRSALIEGAGWWAEAFEAAGFIDAFRVEVLPEGAHPLDVRYNMIQWVHRSTRGWSYGGAMTDLRTGEIIKGHVSLGSLRIRQDRMIFEALAGVEHTGDGTGEDPIEIALARIRQLAAHEVGHTLGFSHNFAASTYGGRASVMDYPAPLIRVGEDGELDFSDAYGVGIGVWDVHALRYAYSEFGDEVSEFEGLGAIVREGLAAGFEFISDSDARNPGGAHPRAHLWDNGRDATEGLLLALRVRKIALDRFGEKNIREGEAMSSLRARIVPAYLHHRYQLEAACKLVGGLDFAFSVRGDGQARAAALSEDRQRAALRAVLVCIEPATLDIPDSALAVLEPRAYGIESGEVFAGDTGPAFDTLGAAGSAADIALSLLLHPTRAARLVEQHANDAAQLGWVEVLDGLVERVFTAAGEGRRGAIARRVQDLLVVRLIRLAGNGRAPPEVRSETEAALSRLRERLGAASGEAHAARLIREIDRFSARDLENVGAGEGADEPPAGSPIGLDWRYADCGWGG